ncbi:hypothetical protein LCGC14_1094650 [marine sediment metagenome]|uniref:Uncharacterized protein n=1 Tax=marine sediment metagenome TaxID=412755 RepID=A0A0F9PUE1_9ZZZZ
MTKKKKETCPYCGKSFAYLSRHKCKIKERVEGSPEEKSVSERRIERIEEKKKEFNRSLHKDEKMILSIIKREKHLYFNDLLELSNIPSIDLEMILEILDLQSKIEIKRELVYASWTKYISAIEEIDVKINEVKIDMEKKDFIWNMFSRQPCFICPFRSKCNDTNMNQFNPQNCIWLTDWIEVISEGGEYNINFGEIGASLGDI